MLLFSHSYPGVFHTTSMWMTITAPDVKGSSELCFLFFPPWNLMWQSSSRAQVVTEAHNKGGGFFFSKRSRSRFAKKKRGSRIKMRMTFAISGGLLYASHWCAFSQSEPARGRICIANWQRTGPFHKWTGGPGAWFPHTPHPSFIPPPRQTPNPPPSRPKKKPLLAQVAPIVATAEAAQRSPRLTPQSRHTQWGLCSSSKAWGGSGSRGGDRQLWQAVSKGVVCAVLLVSPLNAKLHVCLFVFPSALPSKKHFCAHGVYRVTIMWGVKVHECGLFKLSDLWSGFTK